MRPSFGFADAMGRWLSLHDCLPWLSKGKPYFVHAAEEDRLRASLQSAGFTIVTMQGSRISGEKDLLEALGKALRFPDYYGANWDAFVDCAGDMVSRHDPVALIWTDADVLLKKDLHSFVRSIHEILSVAGDLEALKDAFQFEIFLVGSEDAFRNGPPLSDPSPPSSP